MGDTQALTARVDGRDPISPAELRARRLALGLTQVDLATALGVASNTVARWERGQRAVGAPELVRLALERLEANAPPVPPGESHSDAPDPASSASAAPPTPLTSFVGRVAEVAAVRRLLNDSRLLTLVGPAGTGKTRLALRVATEAPGVVVWVELGPLSDPNQVLKAVASAVGVVELAGRPLVETVIHTLSDRRLLLVLDNCEHLVQTVAELAGRLLTACPRLRLLATSREALGVMGETTWLVPPLAVPDVDARLSLQRLSRSDAVRLYVERSSAISSFTLTEHNAALIAELCRRLDGNPLAVELAAARAGVLGIDELIARLDDRFRLLVRSDRSGPPRQQTLRAAIDWSYDLLTEPERRLFERLSVFKGGWTLEAAEFVGSGHDICATDIPDLLTQLVAKSVVTAEPSQDGVTIRYRLLQTLRDYAQEHLAARGELEDGGRRHAEYCLRLAECAAAELWSPAGGRWLALLNAELDNLQAGLGWCLEVDAELGLRLASQLWGFWQLRGDLVDGHRWMQALLERTSRPTPARASALLRACPVSMRLGANARARGWMEQSWSIYRSVDDVAGSIEALHHLAAADCLRAHFDGARQHLEDALALSQSAELQAQRASVTHSLGVVAYFEGDFSRAHTLLESSLMLLSGLDDAARVLPLVVNLGAHIARERQDHRWRVTWEDTLCLFRELNAASLRAYTLASLGSLARATGEMERAQVLLRESLACFERAGDRHGTAQVLAQLGTLATCVGDYARARHLLDASLAMRRALGDRRGIGLAQRGLAHLGVAQSDWARARASYEHCLAHFRTMGDLAGVNTVQQDLADLALDCGTHHEAEDLLHDSLCVDARLGDDWSIARHGLQSGFFVWVVGLARARLPDPPRDGAGFFKEVLRVQQRWQGEHGLATCFRELARAALERSDDLHAEQLSGAADALDAQASAAVDVGPDVSTTTRRRTHGPAGAWQQGRVMPPERTLAVALVNSPELWSVAPSEPRQRLAQLPGALTSREVEVLRLVATGLTNHEIASRLVVSERTVATHMDHIFAKIQVSSRAAATAFAIRSGIA